MNGIIGFLNQIEDVHQNKLNQSFPLLRCSKKPQSRLSPMRSRCGCKATGPRAPTLPNTPDALNPDCCAHCLRSCAFGVKSLPPKRLQKVEKVEKLPPSWSPPSWPRRQLASLFVLAKLASCIPRRQNFSKKLVRNLGPSFDPSILRLWWSSVYFHSTFISEKNSSASRPKKFDHSEETPARFIVFNLERKKNDRLFYEENTH